MRKLNEVVRISRRDIDPTASEFITSGYLERSRPGGVLYDPVTIITGMMVGAAVGAVSAAVTGGNILKGALFGAIGGAIGGAFSGAFGAASGTGGGAAAGAVDAAAGAGFVGEGAVSGVAAWDGAAAAAGGAEGAASAAAGGFNNPSAFTAAPEAGMMGNNPSAYVAPQAPATGPINTTIGGGQSAAGSGITPPGPIDTGTAPDVTNTGVYSNPLDGRLANGTATTPLEPQGSFLDNLLAKGSSMMNSRFGTDMAGKVISGYAQGQNQQALLDWKQGQINDARANARFGNVGSRYATAGMMGPATYSPK